MLLHVAYSTMHSAHSIVYQAYSTMHLAYSIVYPCNLTMCIAYCIVYQPAYLRIIMTSAIWLFGLYRLDCIEVRQNMTWHLSASYSADRGVTASSHWLDLHRGDGTYYRPTLSTFSIRA